jgi:hypothetical protein
MRPDDPAPARSGGRRHGNGGRNTCPLDLCAQENSSIAETV